RLIQVVGPLAERALCLRFGQTFLEEGQIALKAGGFDVGEVVGDDVLAMGIRHDTGGRQVEAVVHGERSGVEGSGGSRIRAVERGRRPRAVKPGARSSADDSVFLDLLGTGSTDHPSPSYFRWN